MAVSESHRGLYKRLKENGISGVYVFYSPTEDEKRYGFLFWTDLKDVNEALDGIVKKIGCSKADAIRDAIRYYADYLRGLEVIRYREIGRENAKEEIKAYIKGKK